MISVNPGGVVQVMSAFSSVSLFLVALAQGTVGKDRRTGFRNEWHFQWMNAWNASFFLK